MKYQILSQLCHLLVFGICSGIVITGCKDNDKKSKVCDPGLVQECPCAGEGRGVQECEADGEKWGPCTGCSEEDSESESGISLGECEYTECVGDVCEGTESCCPDAACNDWIFSPDDGYIENYCYPTCDEENEDDPCKCGDVCLEVDGLPICVKTGGFQMDDVVSPVSGVGNAVLVDADDLDFVITHGDEAIPMDRFDFYWTEWEDSNEETQREVVILGRGEVGVSSGWFLRIAIPEEVYDRGPGVYSNEDGRAFFAEFYFGAFDRDGTLDELWLEAALDIDDSKLTIHETCAPCLPGPDPDAGVADGGADTGGGIEDCEICRFSFDFFWYVLRAKVTLVD